jgi:hypothetical protein
VNSEKLEAGMTLVLGTGLCLIIGSWSRYGKAKADLWVPSRTMLGELALVDTKA